MTDQTIETLKAMLRDCDVEPGRATAIADAVRRLEALADSPLAWQTVDALRADLTAKSNAALRADLARVTAERDLMSNLADLYRRHARNS
jgi:hypothetical protein